MRRLPVVNVVNQLRVLGRWMRIATIPNQSSVPKDFMEFDGHDRSDYLSNRYSERLASAEELSERVNQRAI